jgi:hypothetical protein
MFPLADLYLEYPRWSSRESHPTGNYCCRSYEGMQLDDWTQLSGLTGLTLRHNDVCHSDTLVAMPPRLTSLRSHQDSDWSFFKGFGCSRVPLCS